MITDTPGYIYVEGTYSIGGKLSMDKQERKPGWQDTKVDCPDCKGTGQKPSAILPNSTKRCCLCQGSGKVFQYCILTKLEEGVMERIYEDVPVSAMCPRCETEIESENCIESTDSSRREWAKMVREVIRMIKEDTNENQPAE